MGPKAVSDQRPAFYARTGSRSSDLISLLHIPYTLWHLSYVAIGAALAPSLDWVVLTGTLAAFTIGLGVGAHALDEVKSRPLGTGLSDRALWALGIGALAFSIVISIIGAFQLSPWTVAWVLAGVLLAVGYALDWPILHTDTGFALAWGAFPVVVGHWAQTETVSAPAAVVAGAAILLSLAQRALSTLARFVRRHTNQSVVDFDADRQWGRMELLRTWEQPLRLLTWSAVAIAVGLLSTHL